MHALKTREKKSIAIKSTQTTMITKLQFTNRRNTKKYGCVSECDRKVKEVAEMVYLNWFLHSIVTIKSSQCFFLLFTFNRKISKKNLL